MRRGAAWPAKRPSSCLTARSAVSRTDRWPHRRACMGRRAPQAPSAGTRFGVPAGSRSAWWPRISGAGRALSACPVLSSIRRPVSGVSVQCPRVRVHATGVQCPVRASRRPGVRCPVWRPVSGVRLGVRASGHPASAIRAFPRLLCPNRVSSSSAPMRRAATRRGRPGSAWSPRTVSTTGWSSARVGAWRSKLAQAVLGQRRHRLGPGRRRGRWLGSGQVDRVADQDRLDARGGSPVGRGNVCSEVRLPVAGLRGTSHPRPLLLRAQETFLCGKPLTALSADSSRRSRATRRVGCSDSPDGYHAVGIKPLTSPCRPHHHRR